MSDLIRKHNPVRTLRSSSQHLLAVHPANMQDGAQSFVAWAPAVEFSALPFMILREPY